MYETPSALVPMEGKVELGSDADRIWPMNTGWLLGHPINFFQGDMQWCDQDHSNIIL